MKVVWREVGFGGVIVRGLMSHKPRKEVDGGTNKPAVMSKRAGRYFHVDFIVIDTLSQSYT